MLIRIAPLALIAGLAITAGATAQQPLPDTVRQALDAALEDERTAEAVYDATMARFGKVRPFVNIIEAERRHQSMLLDLYKAHGIPAPANPYETGAKAKPAALASLAEACATGIQAEIDNRDLYDKKLMPAAAAYPDIVQVMRYLRDASANNHLPAFRRCAGT